MMTGAAPRNSASSAARRCSSGWSSSNCLPRYSKSYAMNATGVSRRRLSGTFLRAMRGCRALNASARPSRQARSSPSNTAVLPGVAIASAISGNAAVASSMPRVKMRTRSPSRWICARIPSYLSSTTHSSGAATLAMASIGLANMKSSGRKRRASMRSSSPRRAATATCARFPSLLLASRMASTGRSCAAATASSTIFSSRPMRGLPLAILMTYATVRGRWRWNAAASNAAFCPVFLASSKRTNSSSAPSSVSGSEPGVWRSNRPMPSPASPVSRRQSRRVSGSHGIAAWAASRKAA